MEFRAVENVEIAFKDFFEFVDVFLRLDVGDDLVGAEENSIFVFLYKLGEFVLIFAHTAEASGCVFDVAEACVGVEIGIFVEEFGERVELFGN